MNYRHIYHAGNFADVIKHLVLIASIIHFKKKDKPFCVLDAFAGTGLYDLKSEASLKTEESSNGIKLLDGINHDLPYIWKAYMDLIDTYNEDKAIRYYPGSPLIISNMISNNDQLIACELHRDDYLKLKNLFTKNKNCAIHNIDAFLAVKAFLPFKQKRGIIFLDPAFEEKDEFEKLIKIFELFFVRAISATSILWYPIKDKIAVANFYQRYNSIGFKERLLIEFSLPTISKRLNKCGILITTPPNLKQELEELFNYLKQYVYSDGAFTITHKYHITA